MRSEKKDSYSSGGSGPFDWGHASAGEAFWPEASTVLCTSGTQHFLKRMNMYFLLFNNLHSCIFNIKYA